MAQWRGGAGVVLFALPGSRHWLVAAPCPHTLRRPALKTKCVHTLLGAGKPREKNNRINSGHTEELRGLRGDREGQNAEEQRVHRWVQRMLGQSSRHCCCEEQVL